ncbi:hypothetical protein ISS05_00685 [Candidatus Woesearchaeota archaeon]|nr:hypothetical protein [Candidatus Woesearchaeota archaeon]
MKKPENIREFVWKIIDMDLSLKKDLSRGIINTRALANYIIDNHKINTSIDSVISAIRRYNIVPEKNRDAGIVYKLLKQAEIRTLTKMAYLSLKKNEDTTLKLSQILPKINFEAGETLRILEGSKIFKIMINQNSYDRMHELFGKKNIIDSNKKIGMIEMVYPDILKKTPGVFSVISTELAQNNISIIDALICSNEHIIVVNENDILKAFEILNNLCK